MSSSSLIVASVVTSLAIYFNSVLYNAIFVFGGVGRTVYPIEDFPYSCRRVYHESLQSCEHMWIDEEQRKLYAAGVDLGSRAGWAPNVQRLNASARTLTDRIIVLDIDKPGDDGLYGLHPLEITGDYLSAEGGKNLDLLAFDVQILPDSTRRFIMINHRLPVDASGKALDSKKTGANTTFEVFDLPESGSELKHVKTVVSEAIVSPNSIVATGEESFVFTNDHGRKTGLRFELEPFLGEGTVAVCPSFSECHIAAKDEFTFPNGITRGKDGLFYVAHSASGKITVHSLQADGSLTKIDEIKLQVAIDNLSIDSTGDIFAAVFPDMIRSVKALNSPVVIDAPAAVWRIRKVGEKYETKKVLEDKEAKVLPLATIAVHDVKTGRLFLGGVKSDFIAVCEPKE